MKKWLVFILALLVITGSIIPCCYEDDCQEEIAASDCGSDHDQKAHSCSPFYTCGSCVGFVQLSKPVTIVVPDLCRLTHHEKGIPYFPLTYSSSLFQPPKNS